MKICTKCNTEYPATVEYFPRNKTGKDGLESRCKKCVVIATAIWRKKNPEKYLKHNRVLSKNYYWKDIEAQHKRGKKYRQINKEKECVRLRRYRETLRGYVTHLVAEIRQRCTNPNKQRYECYGARGIKCLFTSKELYDWLVVNDIDPRGKDIHRIDNDGDYVLSNIEFLVRAKHAMRHSKVLV